ncbi:MAG: hypothetical protein LBP60_04895 [Spirochaetaceae bacterium]|jgi:cation transport ATPase|nr:hypothetical protein [Spirochaetaceae bacterium]
MEKDILQFKVNCSPNTKLNVQTLDAAAVFASLTGEPLPVLKRTGNAVFAGTVVEEGELVITVRSAAGESRVGKIISIIDESEKLKARI